MIRGKLPSILILILCFSCSNNSGEEKTEYLTIYTIHQSGDHQKSRAMIEEYVKKYPLSYKGWAFYGVVLLEDEHDSIAEMAFNKALEINPRIKQALTGLGVINRRKGNYLEAEGLYKKALEIDPEFPEAYSSLMIIELIRKDFHQAVTVGQKAWNLDAKSGVIAANLSIAYHFEGNFESRDKFFNHAKQLGYDELDALERVYEGKITLKELLGIKPEQ